MANSVEKFTSCFLDPLRYDESKREEFGDGLEEILDDAIQLDQKKVLRKERHVDMIMDRRSYTHCSQAFIHNCLNCVYKLRLLIMSSYLSPRFKYMIFHIFICILHLLPVYYELTM